MLVCVLNVCFACLFMCLCVFMYVFLCVFVCLVSHFFLNVHYVCVVTFASLCNYI